MVSRATFFTAVIILNLTVFILSTKFIISGTLKCNKTGFPGAKVSVCDGKNEKKPTITATSGSDGSFTLKADLSNPDSVYRVSIYYNCSLNNNKQSNEGVYTRERNYYSLVGQNGNTQTQSNTEYRSPIDNIPDLINATSNSGYKQCDKN
uniref:Pollen Ole e 1 allergen and extensin family protein n=1 Tax=Parastrongyloides trichosuri TaxID=131310 RepID=A0A0N4Z8B7_PARTI